MTRRDLPLAHGDHAGVCKIAPDSPDHVMISLDYNVQPLLVRITCQSCERLRLAPGSAFHAQIKGAALLA